jgi:hypothetical protein
MELKSRFPFDHPPEVIRACIPDAKSIRYITDHHPEVASLEVLKHREEGEKVRLELKYTMDVPMPGPVKKVLGDLNTFVVEIIMDTKSNQGTLEITPSRMADKIKAGGRIYFEQQGNQWVQNIVGDVTVKMFGVGKLVEKFIVASFQKSFDLECKLRNDYLRETRG